MCEVVVGLYRKWLCCCNSLYVFVVCTLTWKNGFAECVEFKLKINQSINQSIGGVTIICFTVKTIGKNCIFC